MTIFSVSASGKNLPCCDFFIFFFKLEKKKVIFLRPGKKVSVTVYCVV